MQDISTADETFWDMLLYKIEEGSVIPVIGAEAIRVTLDNVEQPLETAIADKFAERLKLVDASGGLHAVAARAYQKDSRRNRYAEVHRVLCDLGTLPIPEALRTLAGIDDAFSLFITLSFDDLLHRAVLETRSFDPSGCPHIGYAPNLRKEHKDLPSQDGAPCVYALFGKACSTPEFVISDDDLLEWVSALQDPDNRPQRLFDRLRSHHLLLNWLRTARLADALLHTNGARRAFLRFLRQRNANRQWPTRPVPSGCLP